ncbi:NAD(P)/FAD-dependent oxidoreductase [Streptomyces parvulus]|uniref:NAD(P)/FAD-dependent oxidoreductase n=1 Tax=Streptomyces parvulus TaxID=146923 RepID=UPI0027E2174F|nr:FAD-dependent oxidoreductase [Streptomyces parvulus]
MPCCSAGGPIPLTSVGRRALGDPPEWAPSGPRSGRTRVCPPTVEGDSSLSSDVVVVGAGMAGASVAAELAERLSVVVVEAAASGEEHSTGRSAAAFLPSYGSAGVRALTRASHPLFEAMAGSDAPLLRPRPLLWVATDDPSEHTLTGLQRTSPHLESLSPEQARGLCPPLRSERVRSAAVDRTAADVDVAGLHQAYLRTLRRRGATVLFNAAVRDIERDGQGWNVTAGEHVVHCAKVVRRRGVGRPGGRPRRRTGDRHPVQAAHGLRRPDRVRG